MAKKRPAIPKVTKDRVLSEFNHRCAICGGDRPQVHHIDENPENNDLENLLPLCPNCHLRDHHNPTAPVDRSKLSLFRKFKDPSILNPKFEPLWRRVKRLTEENLEIADLTAACHELASFVEALPMGSFYSARLSELLKKPPARVVWPNSVVEGIGSHHQPVPSAKKISELDIYRDQIDRVRNEVIRLIVEMLRYQDWTSQKTN